MSRFKHHDEIRFRTMNMPFAFQSDTTLYHPQNAYWSACFSQLVYTRMGPKNPAPDRQGMFDTIRSWDQGFEDLRVFDHESSQGLIAQHQNFVMVAFRGTDEKADWLDNIRLFPQPVPMGKVHRGFYQALKAIWDGPQGMKVTIDQWRKGGRSVWITGHSLGGAMATMAAVELVELDEPFYGVYTFGQPRCCDRQLSRAFNIEAKGRFFRFQNQNDIVTRMPTRLMGYSHVGTFIYIDNHHNLSSDIHWWYKLLDSAEGIAEDLFREGLDSIKDHNIGDYIESLGRNLDKNPLTDIAGSR